MERVIKCRAWDKNENKFQYGSLIIEYDGTYKLSYWISELIEEETNFWELVNYCIEVDPKSAGQYTGLKDKSEENTCIYEGDIISLQGIIIGNKYENENLLKEKVNLFIQDFGGKTWCATYKKAMERGCRHSE